MNLAIALAITFWAALLLGMWWTGRQSDRHGMIFSLLGAAWIGPSGLLFCIAAHGMRRGWRLRWLVQVLPALYLLCFIWILSRVSD